jgi:deoxycytidylate deaminase
LDPLPIHPCENCAKVAAKYGIKIIPMHEEIEDLHKYIKK